jgi:hypothetical protein
MLLKHPYFIKYDVKAGEPIRPFVRETSGHHNARQLVQVNQISVIRKVATSSGPGVFALRLRNRQPSRRTKKPLVPGRRAGKRGGKAGFKKMPTGTADDCRVQRHEWPGAMLLVVVFVVVFVILIR